MTVQLSTAVGIGPAEEPPAAEGRRGNQFKDRVGRNGRGEEQRPFDLPRRRSKQHRTPQSGVDRYAQGLHPKRGFIGGKANRSDRRSGAQPYTPPEPSPYAGLCLLSPGGESRSPGGETSCPAPGRRAFLPYRSAHSGTPLIRPSVPTGAPSPGGRHGDAHPKGSPLRGAGSRRLTERLPQI